MENLRTDFLDDVLNTSENTRRKFRIITNDDGTISFEDVTAYSQVGDSFGAADVNRITGAVNELNESLFNNIKDYANLNFDNAEFGVYTNGAIPSSAGASNYPVNKTGLLICYKTGSVSTQIYHVYDGATYIRKRYSTLAWEEWDSYALNSDLAALEARIAALEAKV